MGQRVLELNDEKPVDEPGLAAMGQRVKELQRQLDGKNQELDAIQSERLPVDSSGSDSNQ
jgi:hypothetical protein